jgi:hypothetical protein
MGVPQCHSRALAGLRNQLFGGVALYFATVLLGTRPPAAGLLRRMRKSYLGLVRSSDSALSLLATERDASLARLLLD